ncbi:MAG: NYN domain-containing protein [Chloroflexota bacterium]
MKKPQTNYAFIDGTNLHLTMVNLGWNLDYKRFRVYLSEHYGVAKAYYFIGYVPENIDLYVSLQSAGYVLVHKPILKLKDGRVKGNVDAEMVLQAMIDYDNYEKAVIVISDGDFCCLVHYLQRMGKLECVLAPCREGCSHLLRKAAGSRIAFMDNLREKLEYKTKRTP